MRNWFEYVCEKIKMRHSVCKQSAVFLTMERKWEFCVRVEVALGD
jgi:hypothetical protein